MGFFDYIKKRLSSKKQDKTEEAVQNPEGETGDSSLGTAVSELAPTSNAKPWWEGEHVTAAPSERTSIEENTTHDTEQEAPVDNEKRLISQKQAHIPKDVVVKPEGEEVSNASFAHTQDAQIAANEEKAAHVEEGDVFKDTIAKSKEVKYLSQYQDIDDNIQRNTSTSEVVSPFRDNQATILTKDDVLSVQKDTGDNISDEKPKKRKEKRRGFFASLKRLFVGRSKIDRDVLDDIEELLITTDMGVDTAERLIKKLKKQEEKLDFETAVEILKEEIIDLLTTTSQEREVTVDELPKKPYVILVVGVNGVGKTTTIGKLVYLFQQQGKRVMLGAADTFRAAAVDQLTIWGEKLKAPVVSLGMGKDPGSVAYEAVAKSIAQDIDVLLIDTAGRLHNKVGLMNELAKIKRVISKKLPGAPDEVLLVVDGSTGQNAWQQALFFNEKLTINSLAVTKLDGVAKGGVIIGLSSELGIPIKYVGIGEKVEDIAFFDAKAFVEQLFAR